MVGAGRLATQLGRALHEQGHDFLQVFSRTEEAAGRLADALGATPVTSIGQVGSSADVYVVALKDSALPEVIPALCKGREQKVFAHTAGSVPMDAFEGMALHYGVLYPVQTFSMGRDVDFSEIPCLVEANDDYAAMTIGQLASSVSRDVRPASSEQRKYVHLAAVFACNFANHCYDLASGIVERSGLPFDVLLPLIGETAAKVRDMPPAEAQTGPAVRYDENVIREQSRLLSYSPFVKDLYEHMTLSIHGKSLKK